MPAAFFYCSFCPPAFAIIFLYRCFIFYFVCKKQSNYLKINN